MNKTRYLLTAILIIAAVLRIWKLGSYPPSLTQDEASLGYNAYSILKTGKDEFGDFLPIIFRSFGDYKPGLYVYFAIPFIALFGLNEFSTRLPSAIAGVTIVYLMYLIIKQMLHSPWLMVKRKEKLNIHHKRSLANENIGKTLAICVALVAALNPWLIHFARGAWEANLSLCLTLAGILFFFKSLKKPRYLLLSSFFFALTFITYQGAKLSTSIVIILLALVYFEEIKTKIFRNIKLVFTSLIIGFLVAAPVLFSFTRGQTGRLTVFSIFSYPRPDEYTEEFLRKADEKKNSPEYYIYHSESLNFARGVLGRLFNHYSTRFLFFEGDYQNPRHSSPYQGMMLLVDFIVIPFGIYALFANKNRKLALFVFLWLILAPLPAALTRDQVHGVRALNMSVPMVITVGMGLSLLINGFSKFKYRIPYYLLLSTFYFLSLTYYFDSYFVHSYKHNARYWFYGYEDTVKKVSEIRNNYDTVIFQQSYNQPYIYFLFYEKYDPKTFQDNYKFKSGGLDVGVIEELENVDFQFYSWPPEIKSNRTLIVGDTVVIPDSYDEERFNLIYEVKFPDDYTVAYRILELK